MSLPELLDPAGHGLFILASFGITFVVLLLNVLVPLLSGRQIRNRLRNERRIRKPIP